MDPTLTVLLYSALAAGAAPFGAVPLLFRHRLPLAWIGWANAVAAGLMLGVAYSLLAPGLAAAPARTACGAALGVVFVALTHLVTGTAELDLNRVDETRPEYGYQVLLRDALHAAPEGIAIGAALATNPASGAFTALAIAAHNVPEGTVLSAIVTGRGARLGDAFGLAFAVNVPQILFAIVTVALTAAAPGVLPWAAGAAVGALICLVMADLLPESYRQAGRTSIALATLLAMGMVVVLNGGPP